MFDFLGFELMKVEHSIWPASTQGLGCLVIAWVHSLTSLAQARDALALRDKPKSSV